MGFEGLGRSKRPQKVAVRERVGVVRKRKADGGDDEDGSDEDVDEDEAGMRYDPEDDAGEGEEGDDDDDDVEGDEAGDDGDDESSEQMPVQEPQHKKRCIDSPPLVWPSGSKKIVSTEQQTATKRAAAKARTTSTNPKHEDSTHPPKPFL
ncbi:hypothetical protein Slin15195_G123790 [Septoria linicola]|uniref:Uncharacterized protein n=1 Tax=Septoria linicola TaxID=215465 RepID=A0A9Q9B1R5_9PEZI|nr:hypothetical protein Slin14017_G079990 [Septoria linicola]USW59060.1 hypothetical protein Slin15195_G123790 [Septoria linicola]